MPYSPEEGVYRPFTNQQSPFEGRLSQRIPLSKSSLSETILPQNLQNDLYYTKAVESSQSPHRVRRVAKNTSSSKDPSFMVPHSLKEDSQRLNRLIALFFEDILKRLEEDPYSLPLLVNEMILLLQECGARLKIYEAYQQFSSWYQLMEALEVISQDSDPENLELFCSALFGFYSQLH